MTEDALFERAVELILRFEGGPAVSRDPDDPGGVTKWGISTRAYPLLDIVNLSREDAVAIYRRDYWDRTAAKLAEVAPVLAVVVFDSAVNQGVDRAIRLLQSCLGVMIDGKIGPVTRMALGAVDEGFVTTQYLAERALHYARLSTFTKFGRGWMRRLFEVQRVAQQIGYG